MTDTLKIHIGELLGKEVRYLFATTDGHGAVVGVVTYNERYSTYSIKAADGSYLNLFEDVGMVRYATDIKGNIRLSV